MIIPANGSRGIGSTREESWYCSNGSSQSSARDRDTYLLLASKSGFPVPVPIPAPFPIRGVQYVSAPGREVALPEPSCGALPAGARTDLFAGLLRKLVKSLASGLLIS